jgi:hypothetical protein
VESAALPASSRLLLPVFALTLFTSAALLFLAQPLVGKLILPLLGGAPEVWNACMVFYQALLLAGYAYAHAAPAWLGVRRQAALHLALLIVPFFFLPMTARPDLVTGGSAFPVVQVFALLFLTIGVPFFVVSASAPLLQRWFADTGHGAARDPYFLYAASNVGSLLALLAYPVLVEPWLRLTDQRVAWTVGYGLLVVLIGGCAVLLWLSPPTPAGAAVPPAAEPPARRERGRSKKRPGRTVAEPTPTPLPPAAAAPAGPVTWPRRLRWLLLAFAPSSLLLGVTNYLTSDLAAIPLLWVPPLAVYLLSFILVFARISPRAQAVAAWAMLAALLLALAGGLPIFTHNLFVLGLAWAGCAAAGYYSFGILKLRERCLLHHALTLALPLTALLIVFLMLSDIRPAVGVNVGLHLVLLFLAASVCHGELALDRPPAGQLTEFYLLLSLGGVLGGLFNVLVAPLAFNWLAEYPLALALVCLLTPPLLQQEKEGKRRLALDVGLASVLALAGAALIGLSLSDRDPDLDFRRLAGGGWVWQALAALLALAAGAVYVARAPKGRRPTRALDLALPAALAVLTVGLIWGLASERIQAGLHELVLWQLAKPDQVHVVTNPETGQTRRLLEAALAVDVRHTLTLTTAIAAFGLPAVLCYCFVERPARFGLGVGAVVLAAAFGGSFHKGLLLQERSYFGVLKVDEVSMEVRTDAAFFGPATYRATVRRLLHGATLHGQQFVDPELRGEPLAYYHRTGPVGVLMAAYNTPSRRLAVIGLGAGTMAAYAEPGQQLTFYEIDPTMKKIAFDDGALFSYVQDARARGVEVRPLVLNDARLALAAEPIPERDADRYGVLVVDAFSSDAIPVHLITHEALRDVYLPRLRRDGLLAFHLSNRFLDLRPVLARLAEAEGLAGYCGDDEDETAPGKARSTWVVLARKPEHLELLPREETLTADELWRALARRFQRRGLEGVLDDYPDLPERLRGWLEKGEMQDVLRKPYLPLRDLEALSGEEKELQKVLLKGLRDDLLEVLAGTWFRLRTRPDVALWTDDFSNLLSVFIWR